MTHEVSMATGSLLSTHAVIDSAFEQGAQHMAPLFSGGHDSLTACYAASLHPKFSGRVHHIRTGIGAKATWDFVNDVCREYGWGLDSYSSPETYEKFVRKNGFPGPGGHRFSYQFLKERCVRQIMNGSSGNIALITGCRSDESERRMGSVDPVKIGEETASQIKYRRNQSLFSVKFPIPNKRRYWVAPCHDWSSEDQRAFMEYYDLPRNPIKQTPIGMSGECFCGAFARPGEIDMIRKYCPDVALEIDRLTVIAKECGKHSVWGTRPDKQKGVVVAQTGPLCNSCDVRAMAAGLIIDQRCGNLTS